MLAPYLLKENIEKRYKIGIIPHFNDLNSPIFYEIYKKMGKDAILISVKDSPDMVIKQIANCENIVSSSLHGLIVADSFGIPNLWIENKFKPQDKELHFKYLDYYSIFDICDIMPVQAIDFLDYDIDIIKERYKINRNKVKEKQNELYDFCKEYFENEW